MILVCPYPCLSCENREIFCQNCSNKLYISLQHFTLKEKIEKLEDYILNEFKSFDSN